MKPLTLAAVIVLVSCRPADTRLPMPPEPTDPEPVGALQPLAAGMVRDTPPSDACTPELAQVSLVGRLRSEEKWGPPGYGETPDQDRRVTIYVLELDRPEVVCADPALEQNSRGESRVSRLQVTGRVDPEKLEASVGRRLTVWGALVHQAWGSDYTPVLIRVDSIPELRISRMPEV